nr:wiskott-Aldrich syndrome protein homolog 1-like [Procambarus clarkii]
MSVPRDPSPSLVPSDLNVPTPPVQQFGPPGPLVSDAAASLPMHVVTAEVHRDSTVTDMKSGTPVAAAPPCVGRSGDPAGPPCDVAPSSGGRASDVVAAAPVALRSSRGSRGPSLVAASDQTRRKQEAQTHSSDTGPPVKRGGSTAGAAVACAPPPPPPPSGGLLGSVAPGAPSGGNEAPKAIEDAQWVVSTNVEGIGRDVLTIKFTKSTKSVGADVPVAPSAAGLPDDVPPVPVAFPMGGSGAPLLGTVGLVGS